MANHLYYGDNLSVLRDHIADASVDLIYLDPPFNSNASYNVLFKAPDGASSAAQIEAFDDTWHWNDSAEAAFADVLRSGNGAAAEMLRAMRGFLGENDMMAYLAMMAARLIELHRVLKPTGSLYLHCDPTASHYLKILLDAVFGKENFRNEIIWKRTSAHSDAKNKFADISDTVLYFVKSAKAYFIPTYTPHDAAYVQRFYRFDDNDGRGPYSLDNMASPSSRPLMMYEWQGYPCPPMGWRYQVDTMTKLHNEERIHYPRTASGEYDTSKRPRLKRYLKEQKGTIISNIWADINPLSAHAAERLGYPTQKPVALLERILNASSNPGDVVLDPFCGCGTTVHAAQKLGRQWIGIDVTHLAIGLIEKRLRDAFPGVQFTTHGVPQDIHAARDLAQRGKYHEFEKWALSLIDARPGNMGKKGADRGLDGRLYFGKTGVGLVSVKAGDNVGVSMIRDLKGTMEREKAGIGVFLTLAEPTKPMVTEAAAAGLHEEPGFSPVPRLQIVTVENALRLRERAVQVPARRDDTFRRAVREVDAGRQRSLDL